MTDDREDMLAQRELAAVTALDLAWDKAQALVLAYIRHDDDDAWDHAQAVGALQTRMRVLEALGATPKDSAARRMRQGT